MNSLHFQPKTRWLVTIILLIAFSIGNAWGETPTTIYHETFGTTGNNTAWSSYSGWSDTHTSSYSSTTTWKVSKTTSTVCELTGSSGSCNAYMMSSAGDLILNFGDISSYTSIVLTFNYWNDAGGGKARTTSFVVSSDGGKTWSSNQLGSATTAAWRSVSYNVTAANAANFSIKISNTSTNGTRVDDIKLVGVASTPSCSTPPTVAAPNKGSFCWT